MVRQSAVLLMEGNQRDLSGFRQSLPHMQHHGRSILKGDSHILRQPQSADVRRRSMLSQQNIDRRDFSTTIGFSTNRVQPAAFIRQSVPPSRPISHPTMIGGFVSQPDFQSEPSRSQYQPFAWSALSANTNQHSSAHYSDAVPEYSEKLSHHGLDDFASGTIDKSGKNVSSPDEINFSVSLGSQKSIKRNTWPILSDHPDGEYSSYQNAPINSAANRNEPLEEHESAVTSTTYQQPFRSTSQTSTSGENKFGSTSVPINEDEKDSDDEPSPYPNKFPTVVEKHTRRECGYQRQPTRSGHKVKKISEKVYNPFTGQHDIQQRTIKYYQKDLVRYCSCGNYEDKSMLVSQGRANDCPGYEIHYSPKCKWKGYTDFFTKETVLIRLCKCYKPV